MGFILKTKLVLDIVKLDGEFFTYKLASLSVKYLKKWIVKLERDYYSKIPSKNLIRAKCLCNLGVKKKTLIYKLTQAITNNPNNNTIGILIDDFKLRIK